MPVHVLHGPDEFRASEALAALRDSLDEDGSLATNTVTLAGRGLSPQELVQHASTPPFLAPARLIVVEGLFAAAGNRKGVVDTWQPFLDFLPLMPETNHVVLMEPPKRDTRNRETLGRSALLNALKQRPHVTVTEFGELKTWARGGPSEVAQWLQDRAVRRGVSIEPRAIEAMAELVGADLRTLAGELEKLATYADGRTVTAEDVRLLTPQVREERIFDVVDAVVDGHAARALQLVNTMLTQEASDEPYIHLMITRQFRLLVRATELLESRASQEDLARVTGARGYALTKLARQARATNRAAVEAGLRSAEASDHAVKTGRLPVALALDLLIVQLAALAPRRRR